MKRKLIFLFLISLIVVGLLHVSFAGVDEVKLFLSEDFGTNSYNVEATTYAVKTFKKLGYNVRKGSFGIMDYTVTGLKSDVLNYIHESGNNYAFYINCHSNSSAFAMKKDDPSTYIYASDITGGWHLVWIDGCNSMASTNFADAFHTIGYSNRASIGWYQTVNNSIIAEWGKHFYKVVGSMSLRDACLAAVGACSNPIPIRFYGDTSWYGYAW